MFDHTETIELVKRAQEGDRASLNRLIERYYPRVQRIVRVRMGEGLRRHVDSTDIVQRAFLVAVAKLDEFSMATEAALLSWLSRIATNQIRDEVKRQRSRGGGAEQSLEAGGGAGGRRPEPAGKGDTPSVDLAGEEEQALLDEAVAELPDDHRELVLLRNYAGCSWAEVADRSGHASPDAARVKHAESKARLAVILARKRGQ